MNEHNWGNNGNELLSVTTAANIKNASSNFFHVEHLFKLMVESAVEYAIFALNGAGRVVNWNPGAERIFGYPEDEIVGQNVSLLFTPEDRAAQAPQKEMAKAAAEGSAADDCWLLKKDGARFWATGKIMALKDDDGKIRGFVKIVRDQTERQQAEQNLSAYETRFREMIRQSPLSTFVLDAEGRVKYVNPAFTRMWGVTLEDLANYSALEDDQAEALGLKPYIERLFAGEVIEIPAVYYDPKKTSSVGEGKACWIKTFGYPMKDENGRVIEVVTMHENVSEKIRAEEDLIRSEQRLALAQEAGNIGSFDWDIVADKALWTQRLESIFGLPPGGFGGSLNNWRSLLHPEDLPRCDQEIAQVLESKAAEWHSEFRILKADSGETRWIETHTRIFYDEEKKPLRMIGVNLDITERKMTEEKLRHSRERFEALVAATSQMVWTTDASGAVIEDSPSWRNFTGQSYDEWKGYGWLDALHPDDREKAEKVWKKAVSEHTFYDLEYRIKNADGEYRWTTVRGVPLRHSDGSIREWVGMNIDITEQKQAEETLRQSHARLEFVLESSKIGQWELDLTTGKATRSLIHDQCFGATEPFSEWSYEKFISFVHPDDRAEVDRKFGEAIREQKEWNFECRVIWDDQSVHWIQAKGNFYRNPGQKPSQMLGIVTEITDRKKAEEALRASEEFNRSMITSSPDCFKILDTEGRLEFMNENGICLLELDSFEAVRNRTWQSFWKDEEYQSAVETVEKAKAGEVARFQGFCPTAKGTPKWWDVIIAPVRGADGKVVRLLSVSRDITASKRAVAEREELLKRELDALRQSELERQKLESLFQQAPAIINIMRGADHVFELVHPAMYEFVGERELLGKSVKEALPEVAEQGFVDLLDQVYQTGEPYFGKETQAVLHKPDGSTRAGYFDFIYQPWHDLDGNTAGVMAFAVEVTDRVLARRLMEEASAEREKILLREQQMRQTAEEASRLKDEFLAMVSHELRTPLNAILGWSQMMRSGVVKPDQYEKAIETIDRSARSQAQLIDDLLDITRIITGKLRLNVAEIDFASVINAALQTIRPAAQAKNIQLTVDAPFEKTEIMGDSERLQQVVWNLLSNAVKFTPKNGEIFVRLEAKGSHMKLIVHDKGEGIEPEFLPYVFDRFSQADMSSTRRRGGLGLGLSIVRHLVEMHGGTIDVFSAGKGQGATFTVVLPVNIESSETERETPRTSIYTDAAVTAPTARLDDVKVLVVDDEPDACGLLKILLEQCGARVSTVTSAAEAYDAILAEAPDVLVSDIAMPDEDGYQLIRKIRELPKEKGGHVPAVALTAYASPSDRKKALAAGFQSHITKPLDQNALVTILASLV